MNPLLPPSESRWWYDTTRPQYLEDALIKSDFYINNRDDPEVLEYIQDELDPILNENAYDELVEGTSNVSMDTWVTGPVTGQYNNRFKTEESVIFLNRKEDIPLRQIVENELEDRDFVQTVTNNNGTVLRRSPRRNTVSPRRQTPSHISPRRGITPIPSPSKVTSTVISPRRGTALNSELTVSPRRMTNAVRSPGQRTIMNGNNTDDRDLPSVNNVGRSIDPRRTDMSISPRRMTSALGSPGQRTVIESREDTDDDTVIDTRLIGLPPVNMLGRSTSPRRSSWVVHDGPVYSTSLTSTTGDNITANLGNIDRESDKESTSTRYLIRDRSTATGDEDLGSIVQLIDSMSSSMTNKPVKYNGNGTLNRMLISSDLSINEDDGQIDISYSEVNRSLLNL